ncbi:MAG: aryl-sulfate sulfotransferase [Chthoniobacterales bacterium]|nr:aryl-sulfate sulfotransferase [Chthoniobacterales bacterium]
MSHFMRVNFCAIAFALSLTTFACRVTASQADDTTIDIVAKTPGPTVFISQLTLQASDTTVISSIRFKIAPKLGSVTRALSGTYSKEYLSDHGYEDPVAGTIFLPVYGLYANFTNTITLTYNFSDGSSKQASTVITTGAFADVCGYATPTVLQGRVPGAYLSYDFFLVRGACSVSPIIMDTDGEVRWTSPINTISIREGSSTFFDNAIYVTQGHQLYRVDLDGTITLTADYASLGSINFHHNIDRGKFGIVLDVNSDDYIECVNMEVDKAGNILKMWNLADIISAAMIAGGDDPSEFVYPPPVDWFHNNSTTYKRSDDSFIVSSRENFVIGLDYGTSEIKWILGDETKQWFLFPSLAKFALTLNAGGVPPIGQHAVSITEDNNLFLIDNGQNSGRHNPPGITLPFTLPRKYKINLATNTATELLDYPGDERLFTNFCGSAYEDAKSNYLVDYASIGGGALAQILGYNAAGVKVFDYQYPGPGCFSAYNSLPLHLESTKFPTVGPQALNLSTRAMVGKGDDVLIGGFIVSGSASKKVALRALGPSLSSAGVAGALADPVLNVYDSTGALLATNNNWEDDPSAAALTADQLAPGDPLEAATLRTLAPGTYTVVVSGRGATTGVALVEAYDLSPLSGSTLANISARGVVGTGDNVLIGGFIVGDVASATVVVRAIGPSLPGNVDQSLSDPALTIFDSNGSEVASNDNWQDDPNSADVQLNGLAPTAPAESALLLNLPAGAYTGVVVSAAGGTGVGLVEVYNLH